MLVYIMIDRVYVSMFICVTVFCTFCFFFFKQKTAYEMRISDWSSDVCSSDLAAVLDQSADPHICTDDHARHAGLCQQDTRLVMGECKLDEDADRKSVV